MLSFGLAMFFIFLILLLKYLSKKNAPPILGIYSQPNRFFYLKFAFMFLILLGKRLLHKYMRRRVVRKGKSHDGTIQVYEADAELENVQDLGLMPKAVDAVYFNASSKDGGTLIAAIARRPGRVCNAFFYLKVDGGELLLSPEMPGTTLDQTEEEEGSYRVGGIKIYNKIPMRAWNIKYSGELKSRDNPDVRRKVTVSVTWSTKWSHFNFNTDMAPHSMARDMAREVWSREYFQLLKEFHQNHYEQMGEINGVATIDGVEHKISMPCIRDHSFGKHRDWKNFHRYALHFIYLENGDCIAVGNVSKPMCFSSLTIGYICLNNLEDRVRPIRAVTHSDFELYKHGEKGTPPTDYGFKFHAGGKMYAVSVVVKDSDKFYIGKQKEALIYERWAQYEVNGIKGWGCTEWHYRNVE